jgi:hypothetical protein
MDDVKIDTAKTLTLTLPTDADSNNVTVVLTHEFGDVVQTSTAATRSSEGVYTITYGQQDSGIYVFNSAGKHRADFTYSISGTEYSQSQYVNVYTPYISWSDFLASHSELSSFESDFDTYEKRARNIINTYCGQTFDSYPEKSITLDGTNHKNLHLPIPICTLRKVTFNPGDSDAEVIHDSTDASLNNIEKVRQPFNFESSYYLRFKANIVQTNTSRLRGKTFKDHSDYKIEGDFGWRYVPLNIKQAADLIITDLMNDDSEYRRHGITSVDMDTLRFTMSNNFYESTGNIEADVLLTDYTLFVMDYVT